MQYGKEIVLKALKKEQQLNNYKFSFFAVKNDMFVFE